MPSKKKPDETAIPAAEPENNAESPGTSAQASDIPDEDINDILAKLDGTPSGLQPGDLVPDSEKQTAEHEGESRIEEGPADVAVPVKSKRPSRSKKTAAANSDAENAAETAETPQTPDSAASKASRRRQPDDSILTIEAKADVETAEDRESIIWHEIRNAYRTRRIMTGILGGIEVMNDGKIIIIVHYKDFRIVIPLKEMMIDPTRGLSVTDFEEQVLQQKKILNTMLGAEIDFVVKGIDSKTRSVVASRREAMLKKRQIFYLNADTTGSYRIYENRIVQARVVAVAEKVVRVEAFGVECSILARDLSWDWVGDARERYSVGDQILVRILSVTRNGLEDISIRVDIRSISDKTKDVNLKKCRIQGKYAGRVTDVYNGVVYIRLSNGANAVAHSCLDRRMPGKKDDVSFAVTQINEERGYAIGIITRIIKQNL